MLAMQVKYTSMLQLDVVMMYVANIVFMYIYLSLLR